MTLGALAEAYVHCGQIARENERDLWLAALFAPERLRPHLHALAAFAHETGGVAARVREPLAGEMRLAWWREALAGARPAEAAGAPIAAAVIDTMMKFALPASIFESLLQALTFDVYDDATESLEALEAYGIATAGALTALRAQVLAEGRETDARAASDAAGAGLALARAVLDFALGRRRPMLAPRALIERHGVSLAEARAGSGGEGLRAAFAELADAAEARFDEAEARLAELPSALAPAFAPLATARLDLKRWRGVAAPFAHAAPWRRQWALWLWARRR
ncbi:MAG: squalene/phytoene synthase family protein [Roseiarcus sp.]|jgi:phytoene synthase